MLAFAENRINIQTEWAVNQDQQARTETNIVLISLDFWERERERQRERREKERERESSRKYMWIDVREDILEER